MTGHDWTRQNGGGTSAQDTVLWTRRIDSPFSSVVCVQFSILSGTRAPAELASWTDQLATRLLRAARIKPPVAASHLSTTWSCHDPLQSCLDLLNATRCTAKPRIQGRPINLTWAPACEAARTVRPADTPFRPKHVRLQSMGTRDLAPTKASESRLAECDAYRPGNTANADHHEPWTSRITVELDGMAPPSW